MLFVDGENFTKRGQVILEEQSVTLLPGRFWSKDVFLWLPLTQATSPFMSPPSFAYSLDPAGLRYPQPQAHAAERAYYYTSMPYSNADDVTATRLAIRELGFEPRMFPRTQGKSKAVDLALATDALTLAGEGRYEVAVIIAGDGDYVPVVEAVKRLGRHVVVGFFGAKRSGLSEELQIAADDFVDLTGYLVRTWQGLHKLDWEQTNMPDPT